jgi:glycosyltransferase involved in cell wall biosynthesis
MTNQDIKFTVIIPTRERADTLQWALKTCATQDYENLEIIVSDNFSNDNTREVVEAYQDKRIRYINTGKRVSMSSNWEFALSHVAIDPQRYVTFVGDDDGLVPNALLDINELIKKLDDVDAIAWRKAQYTWKSSMVYPNTLMVPLEKGLNRLNTKSTLQKILNFDPFEGLPYEDLPCLYNAFVKMTKIEEVKKKSGKFFNSMIPDVYSAIALSSVIDFHYLSNQPYSISGTSKHSNGTSLSAGNSSNEKQAALKSMSEVDIPFHTDLIMCPSVPIYIVESVFQVRDHLGFDLKVNLEKMIERSLQQSKYSRPSKRKEIVDALNIIAEMLHIDKNTYIDELNPTGSKLKLLLFRRLRSLLNRSYLIMLFYSLRKHGTLRVNGNLARLDNIYDATVLTRRIITLQLMKK